MRCRTHRRPERKSERDTDCKESPVKGWTKGIGSSWAPFRSWSPAAAERSPDSHRGEGDAMRHPVRLLMAAVACIALLATLTGVAIAQGILGEKLRSGESVTVAAGETISSDLYAFAGTVRIDGTIDGDLIASGGLVDVTGTVTGDVLAAGGSVNITGTVNGDTRIAGGTLSVGGTDQEDLLAAAGQLPATSSRTLGQ